MRHYDVDEETARGEAFMEEEEDLLLTAAYLQLQIMKKTRKRAIAKALHLEGHSDFAPVDLAYYQHFLCFFCWKILRFGKFRLENTNTELLT